MMPTQALPLLFIAVWFMKCTDVIVPYVDPA